MASSKNYGIVAKFPSKMDELAFYELYHTYSFLYDSEESRKKNSIAILKRCKKKGINLEFRYVVRKEADENKNEQES